MKKCLCCYGPLSDGDVHYHKNCCKTLFHKSAPPVLEISLDDIQNLAKKSVLDRMVVTGVQRKLSLSAQRDNHTVGVSRLTLMHAGDKTLGEFILKPPTPDYSHLPELESLGMNLARASSIETSIHGLIPLKSGELAYICRRFDRQNGKKIPVEDMCQLTEMLTERKYQSSMEKVGATIKKYSANPGNDLITFFDTLLLSFLIGNADMHLKNFSLITHPEVELTPAYDIVPTALVVKDDHEESALTINGKKRKLKRLDFEKLAQNLGIPDVAWTRRFNHFKTLLPKLIEIVERSLIPNDLKGDLTDLMMARAKRLGISADSIEPITPNEY